MREHQARRQPHPRRVWVDLPGMHRQDGRLAPSIRPRDRREDPTRRAHPEAPAPAHWHHLAEPISRRREGPRRCRRPVLSARAGGADSRVVRRVSEAPCSRRWRTPAARAPSSAHGTLSLIDHSGARNDVRRGRAGVDDGPPAGVEVVGERVRRELVHPAMPMTVRADFVARCEDLLHERRMPFRHPSDHEERRRHTGGVDRVEQAARRLHDTRRQRVPVRGVELPADTAEVKPLFDVDGQDVHVTQAFDSRRRIRRWC